MSNTSVVTGILISFIFLTMGNTTGILISFIFLCGYKIIFPLMKRMILGSSTNRVFFDVCNYRKVCHAVRANKLSLQRMGDGEGFLLGYIGVFPFPKVFIYAHAEGHVFVKSPTRSGKTVSIIIPNILSNIHDSLFILDIKGEIYRETFIRRSYYSTVCFLSVTQEDKSIQENREKAHEEGKKHNIPAGKRLFFNPVIYLKGEKDIVFLANAICSSSLTTDQFWTVSASSLLWNMLIAAKDVHGLSFTLRDIYRTCIAGLEDIIALLKKSHSSDVNSFASSFARRSLPEVSGVISSLAAYVFPFSYDSFYPDDDCIEYIEDISLLRTTDLTLYFHSSGSHLLRYNKFIHLFFLYMEEYVMPMQEGRCVRFIIDEFPSLGYIPNLVSMLTFSSSYKFRFLIVCQEIDHVRALYKDASSITSNCVHHIILEVNSIQEARDISARTFKKYAFSIFRGNRKDLGEDDKSSSIHFSKILRMSNKKIYVSMPKSYPLFCRRIRYYSMREVSQYRTVNHKVL